MVLALAFFGMCATMLNPYYPSFLSSSDPAVLASVVDWATPFVALGAYLVSFGCMIHAYRCWRSRHDTGFSVILIAIGIMIFLLGVTVAFGDWPTFAS